jgi:glutaminase
MKNVQIFFIFLYFLYYMINIQEIEKIYNKLKNTKGGKNADYIPELSKVDSDLYAISIYTVDGQMFNIGDYNHEFAIESCSKIFTLALALDEFGIPFVQKKIGENKSNEAFNSICSVDRITNHTINSFDNGGAMATTSLLYEKDKRKFAKNIIDNMSEFAGRKLYVSNKIYKSELLHSEHNLAIAYLLKSYGKFYGDVETCVDIYTRQCSVMVKSSDIAIMAATLANGGINPKTNSKLISKKNVKYILDHMELNGLYNETDDWMEKYGMHAKSGVGGVLLCVIPGKMGIGIISPPLNKYGNSVKGIKTAIKLIDIL